MQWIIANAFVLRVPKSVKNLMQWKRRALVLTSSGKTIWRAYRVLSFGKDESPVAQQLPIKGIQRGDHKKNGEKNSPKGPFELKVAIKVLSDEDSSKASAK